MATSFDPADPGEALEHFMAERHLATLTTVRDDGTPQVTPVGFTYDPTTRRGRVITWADSVKARTVKQRPHSPIAVCHVDGAEWLTFYGTAVVSDDPDEVAEAVARYTARYRPPKERSDRVVIVADIKRIVGRLADQE